MYKYIIHISDIHIRWELDREKEYSLVFDNTFKLMKKNAKDNALILFTGDLIHCKTKITPIVLSLVNKFISGLSECGDVVLIAGNHDLVPGDVDSKYLLDVIRRPENVTYIDKTGEYVFKNVTIGASTLADNEFIKYEDIEKKDDQLVLAIGHYTLKEWLDERKIKAYARVKCVDDFEGYKYACLGDIHSRKSYGNCRYAGSLIQQNFSETGKHGFGVLNIETDKWRRITVSSDYSFKNVHVSQDGKLDLNQDFTEYSYIKLHIPSQFVNNESSYRKEIENYTQVKRFVREIHTKNKSAIFNNTIEDKEIETLPLSEEQILRSLIPQNINQEDILKLHNKYKTDESKYIQNKNKWVLKKLSFENILKYRGKHEVEFDNINGIIGISGLNASGKSSLLKILIFGLSGEISIDYSLVNSEYNKTSQSYNHYKFDTTNILNYDNPPIKKGYIETELFYEEKLYKIYRYIERKGPMVSTNTSIYKKDNGVWTFIKGSLPRYKNKVPEKDVNKYIYNMIGRSSELFVLNVINKNANSFTDMNDVCRFNIFSNIFNLNVYSDISAKVKDEINLIKEQILKSKGKREQVEIPIDDNIANIDIEEYITKLNQLRKDKGILNSIRCSIHEDVKPTLVNLEIVDLKKLYINLLSTKHKHIQNLQHNIPDGNTEVPAEEISFEKLLHNYKQVSHIQKTEDDVPDIKDLPKPMKTDISLEVIDKLNEIMIKYDYDIDDIVDEENKYRQILARYKYDFSKVESSISKINKLREFDISPDKFKLLMAEREFRDVNKQELINKSKTIDRLPMKHIRLARHNTDTMKDLQELMDISINKLHEITNISDIIESLKVGKLKGSHITRLEKLSTIDDVVIEISGDLSDASSRMKQLEFDNRSNRERDEDVKYNKRVTDNEKELSRITTIISEYDKYLHNKKLKELEPYLVELNRRLTYINMYNKYVALKHQYLQNVSYLKEQKEMYNQKMKYESYIRYFNEDLTKNLKNIDTHLYNINYTAEVKTEQINKEINELENKIKAKNSVTTINKSLSDLQEELEKLEIYNKLVREDMKLVILSKYLDQISEFINDILRNLVNFTITLTVSSNVTEKSNKVKLNIIRDNTTGSHSLSAFEDFTLTLASKIVMNIYNNNASATFMILDECLECIDYQNKDKIENLFKMLSERYQHIILITHIESYFSGCNHVIEVTNGNIRVRNN